MLSLRNIHKDYVTGDTVVKALKGVSLDFRDNEFVSILGASGCGKTTMLNIIGGLDRYTDGDLIINGVSTKQYGDGDWDTYRNHTIGFVFQTYNLIMHQTVLGNVELALTLSGVSPKERREMATRALERVGLKDQLNKKPNQLSGGQMQRVAIARAIVNNPDIILADEPTGALDTQTSVQIMDILKELSQDRLVIMVTHNPELAEAYSTRIVRLSDGVLISDSNPVSKVELDDYAFKKTEAERAERESSDPSVNGNGSQKPRISRKNKVKKSSMSFKTALTLSLRNLLTKKARTLLVSFAGSIGIIGIALILSLSDGFQSYINKVQEDTLSSYPLTIEAQTVDMSAMISAMMGIASGEDKEKEPETIYANNMMHKMLATMLQQQVENNLVDFKKQLESNTEIVEKTTAIKYTYDFTPQIFFLKDHPLNKTGQNYQVSPGSMGNMFGPMSQIGVGVTWSEMLDNPKLLQSQYDLVGKESRWPTAYNEVVVVVDKNEEINDYILYSLGLIDPNELVVMMQNLMAGKEIEIKDYSFTYEDILGLEYSLVLNSEYYKAEGNGFTYKTATELNQTIEDSSFKIKVVGIIKPKEAASATSVMGTIGYLSSLTSKIIEVTGEQTIVQRQLNLPDKDVFTGLSFDKSAQSTYNLSMVYTYLKTTLGITDDQAIAMTDGLIDYYVNTLGQTRQQAENSVIEQFKSSLGVADNASYENNLRRLGYVEKENPQTISIYPIDFESKDEIVDWIDAYNAAARAEGKDENIISYTDYIGLMMSSVSIIINAISYVLIGFVSISLVVSSIMIGVITYISVLERTKEIGILRSIGASKKDISRVFNAETFIVGLTAGIFGVAIAALIDVPINLILAALAGLHGIAVIPWWGAIGLVVISVALTLIAGIIPSGLAAKKDPVIALRTE